MSPTLIYAIAFATAAAILAGAARFFARRHSESRAGEARPDLRILSRTRVGIGRTLVVVEVEGRRLLLGSTREQWCAIADLGNRAAGEQGVDTIDAELARAARSARDPRWKHT